MRPRSSKDSEHIPTPGIDVSQHSVSDAGEFVIWDCAGQKEYSITHGMFLGAISHSIFLVLYDLTTLESQQVRECFLIIIFICTLFIFICKYFNHCNNNITKCQRVQNSGIKFIIL